MFKAIAVAAVLATAGLAQAETSAAKKELVARVLKLQQPGIEMMARTLAEQPAMQLMQQVGPALQRLPEDRREAVARDIEADVRKYVDEAGPIVRDRAIKLAPTTIGPLLEERFTEDELKQIIAFLESPVNRKFQGMAQDMQRAMAEKLVAESRAEVEPKVRALQQSATQRLGLTSQPAAAASGAAKAAASGVKK
jgi:hypothetical protein